MCVFLMSLPDRYSSHRLPHCCTPCPLSDNLADASSHSPTNRGNCQPQIHHHLQVRRQAYRTRPCRFIGEGTSSSSPRTYQTVLSRWQGSGSVLIDMALFVPPFILASRIVVTIRLNIYVYIFKPSLRTPGASGTLVLRPHSLSPASLVPL